MKVGSTPLQPQDLEKLSELPRYRIDRRKAERWAHRQIKFLVYDDTNLQQNGFDSDDEEGMVEYAMMVSAGGEAVEEKRRPRLRLR